MVTTSGSGTLGITKNGPNRNHGDVKFVPKMGRSLLSVGQLTNGPQISLTFEGSSYVNSRNNQIITQRKKADENLYQTKKVQLEVVLKT